LTITAILVANRRRPDGEAPSLPEITIIDFSAKASFDLRFVQEIILQKRVELRSTTVDDRRARLSDNNDIEGHTRKMICVFGFQRSSWPLDLNGLFAQNSRSSGGNGTYKDGKPSDSGAKMKCRLIARKS
jgi:hypothetical protein